MKRYYPKCKICRKEFESKYSYALYCSKECKRENDRIRMNKKNGTDPFKKIKCATCGKSFHPAAGGELNCSEDCKIAYAKKKSKEWHRSKRGKSVERQIPVMWDWRDFGDPWLTYRAEWCIGPVTQTQLHPMG